MKKRRMKTALNNEMKWNFGGYTVRDVLDVEEMIAGVDLTYCNIMHTDAMNERSDNEIMVL